MEKVICNTCQMEFYVYPYRIRNSKSKLVYCSRKCQNISMTISDEEKRKNAAARRRVYVQNHPGCGEPYRDKRNLWGKKAYRRVRDEVIKLLGGKCKKCGIEDFRVLCVNHINGGGHKEINSISRGKTYYTYVMNEIKDGSTKYQLLCHNCNTIKRWERNENRKRNN